MAPTITPELFAGSPIEAAYLRTAPRPGDFPRLVEQLRRLDTTEYAWAADAIRGIAAPTMIVVGDCDAVRLEHAVELFGLRGGGVMGDLQGMPATQLAVAPRHVPLHPARLRAARSRRVAAGHDPPFLDAPMPAAS